MPLPRLVRSVAHVCAALHLHSYMAVAVAIPAAAPIALPTAARGAEVSLLLLLLLVLRLRGRWVTWPSSVSPSLRGPTYPLCGTSFTPRGLFTTDWDRRISSSSVLLGPSPEIVSPGLGRI